MSAQPGSAPRIVSLLPAGTEIVHALGFGDQLVGRSHECDFPPGVEKLPVCTASAFAGDGSSAEIDTGIKGLIERGLSIYHVDAEALRALEPDLIVTQDQCEVCAVSLADVEAAVCDWTGATPRVVSLVPAGLTEVWADINRVATALGAEEAGAELIAGAISRLTELAGTTAEAERRPRVACIEWLDPLMAAGNWIPQLVDLAGGENLFGTPGAHAPWIEWDELVAADPDAIVLMPCGFDIARTKAEAAQLAGRPDWRSLRAVRVGAVFAVDANHFFSRPGPRLVESAEIMAEMLHPGRCPFGREGAGWVRWSPGEAD